jgi:predicted Zn-dependent protease
MLGLTGVATMGMLTGCEAYNRAVASTVSPEEEAQLGASAFQSIKSETPPLKSGTVQERVRDIAARIVPASGSEIPFSEWEVVVFDSDEINAFALPGGKIGVYRGILNVAENDAQLATVMGHEVGHVNARHSAQRLGTERVTQAGQALAGFGAQIAGFSPQLAAAASGALIQYGVILPYSRGQELEADSLGLTYMAKARYDPSESIDFWQNMSRAGGGDAPTFLSTHPSGADRIERLQAQMPEAEAIYRQAAS